MIKIIDATLAMLDEYSLNGELVHGFLETMGLLSISGIVLSPKIYQLLDGNLPDGMVYYMELPNMDESCRFPGISYFFSSFCDGLGRSIRNIQVNDVSELKGLEGIGTDKKIRLTGLDDLLLYESRDIYERGMKQLIRVSPFLFPEDTYYCASAIAADYLQYHHNGIAITTFTGIGKKAATEQVLLAMRVVERYKPNFSFEKLPRLRDLFEQLTHSKIPDHTPVIGRKIFHIESGIHVDGVLKKPSNYETFPPELVGAVRKIILGKHSGRSSIRFKLNQLGLSEVYDEEYLLQMVKEMSIKKRGEVTDEMFQTIMREGERYEKENQTG